MGTCFENASGHYYQALTFIQLKRFDDARIKLDEVITRFGKTSFGELARSKSYEIRNIESYNNLKEVRASKRSDELLDL
jgi:hypothetical protein